MSVSLAMPAVFRYSRMVYPFRKLVEEYLQREDLEGIEADCGPVTRETDQASALVRKLYLIGDEFHGLYRRFVMEVIRPMSREPILFQRIPNFRIQFPGNVAVGEFHRDRDYGHSRKELNFLVPFTEARGTAAVWAESEDGKGDFEPRNLGYGEVLAFAGANLKHGNKPNATGKNRLSMDFRILRMSDYEPGKKTVNTDMRFVIGSYWEGPVA